MSTFGLTLNLKSPDRNKQFISNIPRTTGVYRGIHYFSYFCSKNRLWVFVRTTHLTKAVLTSTHNLCFEQKHEKYLNYYSVNFQFLVVKFSIYLNRDVFVMLIK